MVSVAVPSAKVIGRLPVRIEAPFRVMLLTCVSPVVLLTVSVAVALAPAAGLPPVTTTAWPLSTVSALVRRISIVPEPPALQVPQVRLPVRT